MDLMEERKNAKLVPETCISLATKEPVSLEFKFGGGTNRIQYEYWTEVKVPIKIPPEIEKYAIYSKLDYDGGDHQKVEDDQPSRTTATATVIVVIGKLEFQQVPEMTVTGLKSIADFHEGSTFRASVTAEIGEQVFELKHRVMDINEGSGKGKIFRDATFEIFERNIREHKHSKPILPMAAMGKFSIKVFWQHDPLKDLSNNYLLNLSKKMVSPDIQELEGIVTIKPQTGRPLKFSKGRLAACSEKYLHQFAPRLWKDVDLTLPGHRGEQIGEVPLTAFYNFIHGLCIESPMKDPYIAVDLLAVAEYNNIKEMKETMINILFQTSNINVSTSIDLFHFAKLINNKKLMFKAIWNLKGTSKEEIEEYPDAGSILNLMKELHFN